MKWITALALGAVLGFIVPLLFGGPNGVWMGSFASWGTIRPHAGSPGLLFSIPIAVGAAIIFRMFFNWHSR
ncbi:hypothetical protein H9L13_11680 [Sphingomonas lutea]|uniref:Uncharacterized protein n=1 Tax=Sphingomonas lutea TaxID=1045317 RepID=A0A7G9SHC9_9SPHN|nr:hypothetical protein [Sphingomonas lutea]QNN67254.1 hypothetical protein H9L13_11680 [Sphingomonas lutea]